MNFQDIAKEARLLFEVDLKPAQGTRFQPTGFPNLGAATYKLHDGTEMLLVESAQSMANHLENTCWDEGEDALVSTLDGLPFVRSTLPDGSSTNSILEAHRLNSAYIVKSPEFAEKIQPEIGFEKDQPFDRRKLANALFKYDTNALIHGVFLEKVGGTVRLPRVLSAFIEARNVTLAPSGGVKFDRVQPASTGDSTTYGKASDGYGNVPFQRDEYAGEITAYFNIDLAQIRGYGLGEPAENLLIALSIYKVQKFLADGLRLRTACDLVQTDIRITRPHAGFDLPTLKELEAALPQLIAACKTSFASPSITEVTYTK